MEDPGGALRFIVEQQFLHVELLVQFEFLFEFFEQQFQFFEQFEKLQFEQLQFEQFVVIEFEF